MTLELYAVYDNKLGAYLAPYVSANTLTAIRQFETAVGEEDHDFNRHAEDYSLWHLGTYDTDSGNLTAVKKVCVSQAHEILSNMQRIQSA